MPADGLDDLSGELPPLHQSRSNIGVTQAESVQFELVERLLFIRGGFEKRTVFGPERGQQRQSPHVEQQPAKRVLIDRVGSRLFGNHRRGGALYERLLPAVAVMDQQFWFAGIVFHETEVEGEGIGHRRSQNRGRLLDTEDILTDPEVGRICRTDNPCRHGRIGLNGLNNVALFDDRFLRQLQQSHRDRRQRRQLSQRPNFRRINHRGHNLNSRRAVAPRNEPPPSIANKITV